MDIEELESIYNLLHSPVEDNVNVALAILDGHKRLKNKMLREVVDNYQMITFDKTYTRKALKTFNTQDIMHMIGYHKLVVQCLS